MFPHRVVTTLPSLLPVIHEHEDVPPAIPRLIRPTIPPRSYRRARSAADNLWIDEACSADLDNQKQGLLSPVYARSDYGIMDNNFPTQPSDDKDEPRVRFLDRWGRKNLFLLVLGGFLILLALGLGLGFGLEQTSTTANRQSPDQSSARPPSPSPSPSQSPQPSPPQATPQPRRFPAGTYSFTAALMLVQSSCTADPAVFNCYPFTTYSPSTVNQSAARFEWTIEPGGGSATENGSRDYQISSASRSSDPTVPQLANVTLKLLEADTQSERYTFNLTMAKAYVVPNNTATLIPGVATCWYNSTVVKVELWTRERATYPSGIADVPLPTNGIDSSAAVTPWPFKFTMSQVQSPDPRMPDCRDARGTVLGPAINGAGDCQCSYRNFDNDSSSGGGGGSTSSGR